MTKSKLLGLTLAALLVLLLGCTEEEAGDDAGCRGADGDVAGPNPADPPSSGTPDTLDAWNLFADACAQTPKDDVIPYEVTAPLFTDFAAKKRFIYVPPGEEIDLRPGAPDEWDENAPWGFPEGSILVKTFAYPVDERDEALGERLIETRLLVHEASGWRPIVYQWNEAQTEARRVTGGATVDVSYVNAAGDTVEIPFYGIPANGACRECHGALPDTSPIGPKTPMLNRENDYGSGPVNQIDYMHSLGLFDEAPDAEPSRLTFPDPESADIAISDTDKARAYLDSNCAHCHSPEGETAFKELFLDWGSTDPGTTDPFHWGVCKVFTSGGNGTTCTQVYNIEPGSPEDSFLACRVSITGPGAMPEIGKSIVHPAGVEIIEAWIAEMDIPACDS